MHLNQKGTDKKQHALFATKIGAIAATVGSAVGLGNIWRFPYEAGAHGGGAFMLLYVFFIIVLGVPVLCAEFTLGKSTRQGIFGAFRTFKPKSKWPMVGYLGVIATVLVMAFYSVVSGWTLEYLMQSVAGTTGGMNETELSSLFNEFTSGWRPVMWTMMFLLINYFVIRRGVQKGIEKISSIMTPLLFVLILAFCINSLQLPKAGEGLEFLFHPDFSKLTPAVIIGALGQAFFSLSLGFGGMLTYASYFSDNTDIVKNSNITAISDVIIAVMSGLLIFPAVFSFGFSPSGGPRLVFEVLPAIFTQMAGGRVWASLFFFMLFLASLTSTISLCEIIVAFLTEKTVMKRGKASAISISVIAGLSVLCAFSFSVFKKYSVPGIGQLDFFNWFDYISSNILLPLVGVLICVFVGWVIDKKILKNMLAVSESGKEHSKFRQVVNQGIRFCIRFVAPVLIALIFIINLVGI
ncbi:MAG: sodium-dependent transporter [Muribaculaceae bacterium]|nr:sodium-dependent transporter [Muribaculaceae bacterium]